MGTEYHTPLNDPEDLRHRRKTRVRASNACNACRSRHTKCDGVEPVCTRCQVEEKTCVYTKSRRGGRGRPVPIQGIGVGPLKGSRIANSSDSQNSDSHVKAGSSLFTPHAAKPPAIRHSNNSSDGSVASASDLIEDGNLISQYFEFFHNAHPIILPRRQFLARCHSDPDSLEYLLPVLKFIGAVYTPGSQTDTLRKLAHEKLNSPAIPADGFSVQALVLFSLAIHCSDEYQAADLYLAKAVDIALTIDMNTESFAWKTAAGDAVLAESWRRTWWAVYCIDTLFAAISHQPIHRLKNSMGTVSLPCEDEAYISGNIPEPYTINDYDSREFADEEIIFSSFTYLIDACRIASALLAIKSAERGPGERSLEAANAKFVSWIMYLPKCKMDIVRKEGGVDETMFLATIVYNW
jgi:hypothetical protein